MKSVTGQSAWHSTSPLQVGPDVAAVALWMLKAPVPDAVGCTRSPLISAFEYTSPATGGCNTSVKFSERSTRTPT